MSENSVLFALAISLPTDTALVVVTWMWLRSRDRNKAAERNAARAAQKVSTS